MVIPASPASPHSILSFPDAVFAFPAQGVCFCFPCTRCSFLLSLHKVLLFGLHKASSCSVCIRSEHPFQRVVCTRFSLLCRCIGVIGLTFTQKVFLRARSERHRSRGAQHPIKKAANRSCIGARVHNIRSRRPRTGLASVHAFYFLLRSPQGWADSVSVRYSDATSLPPKQQ